MVRYPTITARPGDVQAGQLLKQIAEDPSISGYVRDLATGRTLFAPAASLMQQPTIQPEDEFQWQRRRDFKLLEQKFESQYEKLRSNYALEDLELVNAAKEDPDRKDFYNRLRDVTLERFRQKQADLAAQTEQARQELFAKYQDIERQLSLVDEAEDKATPDQIYQLKMNILGRRTPAIKPDPQEILEDTQEKLDYIQRLTDSGADPTLIANVARRLGVAIPDPLQAQLQQKMADILSGKKTQAETPPETQPQVTGISPEQGQIPATTLPPHPGSGITGWLKEFNRQYKPPEAWGFIERGDVIPKPKPVTLKGAPEPPDVWGFVKRGDIVPKPKAPGELLRKRHQELYNLLLTNYPQLEPYWSKLDEQDKAEVYIAIQEGRRSADEIVAILEQTYGQNR